jgi:hypothetical protein
MPTILFFRVQAQPFGGAKRAMLIRDGRGLLARAL